MDTASLKFEIDSLGEDAPIERLAEVRDNIDFLKQFVRDIDAQWNGMMLARCERDGDQVIGPKRYYAGIEKKTTCPDAANGLKTIFDCSGGDFGKVAEMFAANPFKPGACREVLGDRWGEVFVVEEKLDLKEGKPSKKLQVVDERFIR